MAPPTRGSYVAPIPNVGAKKAVERTGSSLTVRYVLMQEHLESEADHTLSI